MKELAYCERTLLALASLVLLNGLLVVSLSAGTVNRFVLVLALSMIAGWFGIHFIIRRLGKHHGDPLLFPLLSLLSAIGLTMVFRLKPELFLPQVIWMGIGLLAFLASAFIFRRIRLLADYKYICGVVGVGLLLVAILFGVDIGGHKSWVVLGPVRFQPSEFAKVFIILFLAAYLNERREVLAYATKQYGPFTLPHPRFIGPLLAIWSLAMVMFIVQRDLGSALLYFGTTIIMAYMASGRLSYIVVGVVLFLLGSVICYKFYTHVQTRVDIWINPWDDPNGKAYQVVQSLFALGSGGILGSGLTYGFPTMIPEVHTDFIFAAIGEEMGLMGATAVVLTYILMIYRAFRVALAADDEFCMLVAAGLAVFMALQVFLIVGGVTNFFPLTGITLPMISYGGSSILSNCIIVGMLFALSEKRPADA